MLHEKHDVAWFVQAFPEHQFLFKAPQQARWILGLMWYTCFCDFTAILNCAWKLVRCCGSERDVKLRLSVF